jgi:hypothetical protein
LARARNYFLISCDPPTLPGSFQPFGKEHTGTPGT